MVKLQTLKGFRDFLPKEAVKRQYVINTLKKVFESYGFEPLETPALEYEEVLLGKYGEEGDKLMYRFTDLGGRKVALRYDQTVPLARVVAQYGNELPMPFKRYQIQPVWRAENTQKGRFREFLQCDADIVGTDSVMADAEVISCVIKSAKQLGFKKPQIWINDRTVFDEFKLTRQEITILDKLEKKGKEPVIQELKENGRDNAEELFESITKVEPTEKLKELFMILKNEGFINGDDFKFVSLLARGLDYYTSVIFELKVADIYMLSVCGGGRYDKLIGMFTNKDIPAVGFAFGFDRLMEAMEELNLFPTDLQTTKVLVTVFSPELLEKSLEVATILRSNNINTELYLNENASLDKQLKYADQKGVPFAVITGTDEAKNGTVTLRNMQTRTQETVTPSELLRLIR